MPEKISPFGHWNAEILAVQGINGGFGVLNVALLDVLDLTQTGDLALHGREVTGGLELAQQESSSAPAISLLAWSPATTIRGRRMTLV